MVRGTRNRGMVKCAALLALVVLALAGTAPASAAATTQRFNERFSVEVLTQHPCTGEPVLLSGIIHAAGHFTVDDRGGIHIESHLNPQGYSGVGLDTGTKYHLNGAQNFLINADALFAPPITFSSVAEIHFISQGAAPNFVEYLTSHLTVNANGEPTAEVFHAGAECR